MPGRGKRPGGGCRRSSRRWRGLAGVLPGRDQDAFDSAHLEQVDTALGRSLHPAARRCAHSGRLPQKSTSPGRICLVFVAASAQLFGRHHSGSHARRHGRATARPDRSAVKQNQHSGDDTEQQQKNAAIGHANTQQGKQIAEHHPETQELEPSRLAHVVSVRVRWRRGVEVRATIT